jgi:hypothetical protein
MSASAGKEVLSRFSRNEKQEASRRAGTLPWVIKFETTVLLAPDSFSRKHEKWKRRKHRCLFADVLHGSACGWLDVLDKEKSFSMGCRAEALGPLTKPPLRRGAFLAIFGFFEFF